MAKSVIAFVGENANLILERQSRRFLDLLPPRGLHGHVLNVRSPDFVSRLDGLLAEGVLFGWGYAGVGARLAVRTGPLWDALQVPFVSVLADAPYIMPANHFVRSRYVANGYIYRDWLDQQRDLFRSPQISTLLPMGVIPNPHACEKRWSTRSNRLLFVKTGGDPVRQRARWGAWPPQLRALLHDCADTLVRLGTGPLYPVVQSALVAHGLVLEGARPVLFGVLHELDTYVRAHRATVIAKALLPLPVDIIGDGWDHLLPLQRKARFHPPVDAAELEALYADSQILVNASPNIATGAHERVLRGFAAGCRIVSDDNEHARTALHALPSYSGVEPNDSDLADRLAAVFHDPAPFDDRLDAAHAYVAQHHDPDAFITGMMQLAELTRLQDTMACYQLDAA